MSMKRSLASPPDPFSVHPLLAVLPSRGSLVRLEDFRSALFARYEGVQRGLQSAAQNQEIRRRLSAEEAMLRVVLEWLQLADGGRNEQS